MNLSIDALRQAYVAGDITPRGVVAHIQSSCDNHNDHAIWIYRLSIDELEPYLARLEKIDPATHPLWGIPFAIKDNIDLAGVPTTAACPAFSYVPEQSATVVEKLIAAGAIPIGKTNLDQFATGLNGTRSPYGECRNAFDSERVSGGSSSGSAVAVSLGLASFSLGTDTAGSGRVPAAFNNLIGLKPSRGLLSNQGLVRACRSLDSISIFALTTDDANDVLAVAEGFDSQDEYSRHNPFENQSRQYGQHQGPVRIGVIKPSQLNFFDDPDYPDAYQDTLKLIQKDTNVELIEIDYSPFKEAAALLYEGPWVAERYVAIESVIEEQPEALLPVIRDIIAPGGAPKATELFQAQYRLQALRQECSNALAKVDCLLTPTTTKHPLITDMLADPIALNSQLGYYTNFVNLLDLSAITVPSLFTEQQLPFGITLVADHLRDRHLLSIANRLQQLFNLPMGATQESLIPSRVGTIANPNSIDVVVCGAHLKGLPLNWQLTERNAELIEKTQTSPNYRLYALAGGPPYRPGLVRDEDQGQAIEVERWRLPATAFGSFVAAIPAPLGIGKVELADGSIQVSFICEPYGIADAEEITHFGGWRAYMSSLNN